MSNMYCAQKSSMVLKRSNIRQRNRGLGFYSVLYQHSKRHVEINTRFVKNLNIKAVEGTMKVYFNHLLIYLPYASTYPSGWETSMIGWYSNIFVVQLISFPSFIDLRDNTRSSHSRALNLRLPHFSFRIQKALFASSITAQVEHPGHAHAATSSDSRRETLRGVGLIGC